MVDSVCLGLSLGLESLSKIQVAENFPGASSRDSIALKWARAVQAYRIKYEHGQFKLIVFRIP